MAKLISQTAPLVLV